MSKAQWEGYIKDYDGGTLMQCQLEANVPYITMPAVIAKQKQVGVWVCVSARCVGGACSQQVHESCLV